MGWAVTAAVALVVILVLILLTRTRVGWLIIGAIYPARLLAAQMVRNRLTERRMNPRLFPIRELAQFAVDGAKTQALLATQSWQEKPWQKPWYRTYLAQSAQTAADLAAFVSTGEPSDWSAAEIKAGIDRDMPDVVWGILAKHDPKRFALENLEKTQTINRTLLAD